MQKNFSRPIRCYDCNMMVSGSIKDHHKICSNSRKVKSTIVVDKGASEVHVPTQVVVKYDSATDSKLRVVGRTDQHVNSTDVYFILDVSGSMSGEKLASCKSAVKRLVPEIDKSDRIAIVTFDDKAFFKLKPRPVEQVVRQNELESILSRIFSRGSTAMYDAIDISIDQIHDKSRRTILNVLTDGEDNSSRVTLAQVKQKLREYPNIILNILHVDNSGRINNTYSELALENRGTYKIVREDQLEIEFIMIVKGHYVSNMPNVSSVSTHLQQFANYLSPASI
ncbi:RING zinc finger-containing protein [Yasminevirus sp. GU-2018]|uniref:RING zinc finger-containing protein n=1 Tax=Yasminevirus sp. GU-2018 TaxID=2420051 RepID=A0A5K0U7P5_9VIRU|nr:RING zinc finger-containing protein [Yasminevirus sp. GU-2018]